MIKTAYVGEITMDYLAFGQGDKTLVILPGLSLQSVLLSAAAIEEAYQPFVKAGYTVYLFDRRKHTEACTVTDLAKETAAVMKALGLSETYLFGASQGGMIAQVIAVRYPDLVKCMVLGSTLSKTVPSLKESTGKWLCLAKEKNISALIAASAEMMYSEKSLAAFKDFILKPAAGVTDEELSQFIIMTRSVMDFDITEELGQVHCPVLVMGSFGDRLIPVSSLVQTAEAMDGELFMYDRSYGHAVYDEAADYKTRMLEFFGRTR